MEKRGKIEGKKEGFFLWGMILLLLSILFVQLAGSFTTPLLPLTPEEREWLDNNPEKLVLYYNVEFPPIEFCSPSGDFIGMGADVISAIQELLGITFIQIPSDDWIAHLSALQSGECAVAPTIVRTPQREAYAFFTTPYATAPVVIITSRTLASPLGLDDTAGWEIGVVSGYATEGYLQDQALLTPFTVVPVANVVEGLQRVSFGQLDALVENLAVAAYYIEELGIPNLQVAGETDYSFEWAIGISREYPLLYSSIQKALDGISQQQLADIRKNWITLDTDFGLDPQTQHLLRIIGLFTILLLLGLVVITFLLRYRLKEKIQALRKSEIRYKRLVENSPAVVFQFLMRPDGSFSFPYISESLSFVAEFSSQELVDDPNLFLDQIHPDDKRKFYESVQESATTLEPFHVILKHMKDGQVFWLEIHSTPTALPEGSVLWNGFFQDVTDRKKAEEELRLKSLLLDQIEDFVTITDLHGTITYVNQAEAAALGRLKEELLGESTTVFGEDPAKGASQREIIDNTLQNGSWRGEVVNYGKDGQEHVMDCRTQIISDEKGRPLALCGIATNITHQKKIEEKLRKSEENYREIFHSVKDGIFIQDTITGDIVDLNKSALGMYGCTEKEEMIGEGKWDRFNHVAAGFTQQKAQEMVQEALASDSSTFEWYAKKKNGEPFWVEASVKRTVMDGEERILEVVRDIHERKMVEKALQTREQETREAHQRLLTVLDSIEAGIYVADMETYELLFVNRYMEKIYGQVVGERCWQVLEEGLTGPCDFCTNDRLVDAHGRPTGGYHWEYKNHRTGQWFDCRDSALHWIDGRLVRMEIASDITERKEAEEQLTRYTKEVEALYQQLDQEMDKARQIHKNILPVDLPQIEGISFASYYHPAQLLGGDFFDVVQVQNKLILYLSDVSGHSLDCAMLSVFVKHTIQGYLSFSSIDDITPGRVLRYLVEKFNQENYPEAYFICIFFGVLDLDTMEFSYSGLGFQDTPFVRLGSGKPMQLMSKGLFISSSIPVERIRFQEKTISLSPGSTIFFNTDGLTEQGEAGDYYGERLSHIFYSSAQLPPPMISQAVLEDFQAFNQGSLQGSDDITFLILQLDPVVHREMQQELDTSFLVLETLRSEVQECFYHVQEKNTILTCLIELVINAMEHGNQMDPKKKVSVEILEKEAFVQIAVVDEGEGFNWRSRIDKSMELEGKTERGRGIAMTRILSDGLCYNKKGNQVTCIVKI